MLGLENDHKKESFLTLPSVLQKSILESLGDDFVFSEAVYALKLVSVLYYQAIVILLAQTDSGRFSKIIDFHLKNSCKTFDLISTELIRNSTAFEQFIFYRRFDQSGLTNPERATIIDRFSQAQERVSVFVFFDNYLGQYKKTLLITVLNLIINEKLNKEKADLCYEIVASFSVMDPAVIALYGTLFAQQISNERDYYLPEMVLVKIISSLLADDRTRESTFASIKAYFNAVLGQYQNLDAQLSSENLSPKDRLQLGEKYIGRNPLPEMLLQALRKIALFSGSPEVVHFIADLFIKISSSATTTISSIQTESVSFVLSKKFCIFRLMILSALEFGQARLSLLGKDYLNSVIEFILLNMGSITISKVIDFFAEVSSKTKITIFRKKLTNRLADTFLKNYFLSKEIFDNALGDGNFKKKYKQLLEVIVRSDREFPIFLFKDAQSKSDLEAVKAYLNLCFPCYKNKKLSSEFKQILSESYLMLVEAISPDLATIGFDYTFLKNISHRDAQLFSAPQVSRLINKLLSLFHPGFSDELIMPDPDLVVNEYEKEIADFLVEIIESVPSLSAQDLESFCLEICSIVRPPETDNPRIRYIMAKILLENSGLNEPSKAMLIHQVGCHEMQYPTDIFSVTNKKNEANDANGASQNSNTVFSDNKRVFVDNHAETQEFFYKSYLSLLN